MWMAGASMEHALDRAVDVHGPERCSGTCTGRFIPDMRDAGGPAEIFGVVVHALEVQLQPAGEHWILRAYDLAEDDRMRDLVRAVGALARAGLEPLHIGGAERRTRGLGLGSVLPGHRHTGDHECQGTGENRKDRLSAHRVPPIWLSRSPARCFPERVKVFGFSRL